MVHCSIVGYKNKLANNSEVTYFNLPKDPQERKSWLAIISREKGNLPSNVSVCSNHFEDKYFDKSWIKPVFLHRQTNKKKIDFNSYSNAITHKQISTSRKTSEIREKQKEKEEVKL